VLDKAEYSAFESTLNSLYRIVSYPFDKYTVRMNTVECSPEGTRVTMEERVRERDEF